MAAFLAVMTGVASGLVFDDGVVAGTFTAAVTLLGCMAFIWIAKRKAR